MSQIDLKLFSVFFLYSLLFPANVSSALKTENKPKQAKPHPSSALGSCLSPSFYTHCLQLHTRHCPFSNPQLNAIQLIGPFSPFKCLTTSDVLTTKDSLTVCGSQRHFILRQLPSWNFPSILASSACWFSRPLTRSPKALCSQVFPSSYKQFPLHCFPALFSLFSFLTLAWGIPSTLWLCSLFMGWTAYPTKSYHLKFQPSASWNLIIFWR